MEKDLRLKVALGIIESCLLINILLMPKLFVIYIFTGVYVYFIYVKFGADLKRFLYNCTLLFSLEFLALYMPLGKNYSMYYFYIGILVYWLYYFVTVLRSGNKRFNLHYFKNKYFVFLMVFIAYMLFSIIIAENRSAAVQIVVIYFIMFCFTIMVINENDTASRVKETFKLLEAIYTGILFLGTLEIFGIKYGLRNHFLDYGYNFEKSPYTQRIPVVFFYNPNNYAAFLVISMIVIFVFFIFSKDKKRRIWLICMYLLSQINLIFTRGRTAWLSLLIILVFALMLSLLYKLKEFRSYTIKCIAATIGVFLITYYIPFMAPYYGKITPVAKKTSINAKGTKVITYKQLSGNKGPKSSKIVNLGESGSLNERYTIIYDVTKGVLTKGHFFGFGAGNTEYYISSINNTSGVVNVHSLIFEILGDFGVPICLYASYIYLCLILELIKGSIRNKKIHNKYGLIFGLSTFGFIFLSFGPSTVITFTPFWLLMGLGVGVIFHEPVLLQK